MRHLRDNELQVDQVMSEVTSQSPQDGGSQDVRNETGRRSRSNKKFWREKKKAMEIATMKFKGATLDLKGHYIATYQEVPVRAEVACRKTTEAMERHY